MSAAAAGTHLSAPRAGHGGAPDPLPVVRAAVRSLLEATPEYARLAPAERRAMARAMVAVCHTAAILLREEMESDDAAAAALGLAAGADAGAPLARAQNAGREFSGVSARQVAGTTRAILNAVSFPRFVTELINGVFKAIVDSNQQQLHQYIELLNNVAVSTDGFADANMGAGAARQWLVERFPASFEIEPQDPDEAEYRDPDDSSEPPVRLRPGAAMPTEGALRAGLGIGEGESVPSGDPERVLVPLARRQLAKQRQEMLATMVMLGMQRIVVDSGRISAGMRFHIDTRSAAESDTASRFDFSNQISAQGQFGVGPWGASAAIQNTIGYVSTQATRTTEEMNTDLELTSHVELNFHSDYLPLNQLAAPGQAQRITANSRNPEFEAARAAEQARREAAAASDGVRRTAHREALAPRQMTPLAAPPLPASGQSPPATRAPAAASPPAGAAPSPAAPSPAAPAPAAPAPAPAPSPSAPAAAPPATAPPPAAGAPAPAPAPAAPAA